MPNNNSSNTLLEQGVHWNDYRILEAAGLTPEPVRLLLAQYQQPLPSYGAIYQWASRRKIPDRWRAPIIYCRRADERLGPRELFRRGPGGRVRNGAA